MKTHCAGIFIAVAVAVSAQHFPPLDRDNPAKSRVVLSDQYCMTARKSISSSSSMPLFSYDFAAPGASGSVIIDGKVVVSFNGEQHVRVHAAVSEGDHQFRLVLDQPAILTFMDSNDDFKYCRP